MATITITLRETGQSVTATLKAADKKHICFCNRDITVDEFKKIVETLRKDQPYGKTGISVFDRIKMGILSESEYDGKDPDEEIPLTKEEKVKKEKGEKDVVYNRFVSELNAMFNKYQIKTCISKMYFLAQSYAETDRFRRTLEIKDGSYAEGNHIFSALYKGRGFIHITGIYQYFKYLNYYHFNHKLVEKEIEIRKKEIQDGIVKNKKGISLIKGNIYNDVSEMDTIFLKKFSEYKDVFSERIKTKVYEQKGYNPYFNKLLYKFANENEKDKNKQKEYIDDFYNKPTYESKAFRKEQTIKLLKESTDISSNDKLGIILYGGHIEETVKEKLDLFRILIATDLHFALDSAGWFWVNGWGEQGTIVGSGAGKKSINLNSNDESLSEDSKIKLITKRVRGTEEGTMERKGYFDSIKKAINYDKSKCPTI